MQQKTHRPAQFEITEPTRDALSVDQGLGTAIRRLVICGLERRGPPFDTSILEDRSSLDRGPGRRCLRVRNSIHQKNEGIAHL
jgi:hypothetical protein